MRVLIDPGHGGENLGALGIEKDLNLETGLLLWKFLAPARGVSCALKRAEDFDMSLAERAEGSESYGLAVSIHYNWSSNQKNKGAQVFNKVGDKKGRQLAKCIGGHIQPITVEPNDKFYPNAYNVLHNYKCPAVLVECLFLSNEDDLALLKRPLTKSRIAMAIAIGILEWTDANT